METPLTRKSGPGSSLSSLTSSQGPGLYARQKGPLLTSPQPNASPKRIARVNDTLAEVSNEKSGIQNRNSSVFNFSDNRVLSPISIRNRTRSLKNLFAGSEDSQSPMTPSAWILDTQNIKQNGDGFTTPRTIRKEITSSILSTRPKEVQKFRIVGNSGMTEQRNEGKAGSRILMESASASTNKKSALSSALWKQRAAQKLLSPDYNGDSDSSSSELSPFHPDAHLRLMSGNKRRSMASLIAELAEKNDDAGNRYANDGRSNAKFIEELKVSSESIDDESVFSLQEEAANQITYEQGPDDTLKIGDGLSSVSFAEEPLVRSPGVIAAVPSTTSWYDLDASADVIDERQSVHTLEVSEMSRASHADSLRGARLAGSLAQGIASTAELPQLRSSLTSATHSRSRGSSVNTENPLPDMPSSDHPYEHNEPRTNACDVSSALYVSTYQSTSERGGDGSSGISEHKAQGRPPHPKSLSSTASSHHTTQSATGSSASGAPSARSVYSRESIRSRQYSVMHGETPKDLHNSVQTRESMHSEEASADRVGLPVPLQIDTIPSPTTPKFPATVRGDRETFNRYEYDLNGPPVAKGADSFDSNSHSFHAQGSEIIVKTVESITPSKYGQSTPPGFANAKNVSLLSLSMNQVFTPKTSPDKADIPNSPQRSEISQSIYSFGGSTSTLPESRIVAPNVAKLSPSSCVEVRLVSESDCVAMLCSVDVLKMRSVFFKDVLNAQEEVELKTPSNDGNLQKQMRPPSVLASKADRIWRSHIVIPEDSPFEAAAFIESLHEAHAMFTGEWNSKWAKLSVFWLVEDYIHDYTSQIDALMERLAHTLQRSHWRTTPACLTGQRIAVFRKTPSPLPTIMLGTILEPANSARPSTVRVAFDGSGFTICTHLDASSRLRKSQNRAAENERNKARAKPPGVVVSRRESAFILEANGRPPSSTTPYGDRMDASVGPGSGQGSNQCEICIAKRAAYAANPTIGDVAEPFWVQEASGCAWEEPDQWCRAAQSRLLSPSDHKVFWEMAEAIVLLPSLRKRLEGPVRDPRSLGDFLRQRENRVLWRMETPDILPKDIAEALVRSAYIG